MSTPFGEHVRAARSVKLIGGWALAMLGAFANAAFADPWGASSDDAQLSGIETPASLPQVTVEAQREAKRKRVAHFVATVTRQVSSYESLARWHDQVCPAVMGLPRAQDEFILARISAIARSTGVPLAPEHCTPNAFVVITADTSAFFQTLYARQSGKFVDTSGSRMPVRAIHEFANSTKPIRALYNSALVGALGNPLNSNQCPEVPGRLKNCEASLSRLRWDDVQSIGSVFILADAKRINGMNIGAVADYISLLSLAEINLDADFSAQDSVLRLFDNSTDAKTISALSAWDAAFLKALYATDQSDRHQFSAIVNHMMGDTSVFRVQ